MPAKPKDNSCKSRIEGEVKARLRDLHRLREAYQDGAEGEEIESIFDYGLSFDYVAPGTFDGQKEGYFRYQLSWGGPSDEFRFFVNPDMSCHRVEYWLMDWFDGASRILADADEAFLFELWDWFTELGSVEAVMRTHGR